MAITKTYDSSKGCFDAYLMNSVRNKAFSWLRGERRHGGRDTGGEVEQPTEESERSPEELWCLKDAFDELSKDHQEIIRLLDYESLKQEEVAQKLGIAPGTVKSRHSRALENLRGIFRKMAADQERGFSSSESEGRTQVRRSRPSTVLESREMVSTDPETRGRECLRPKRTTRPDPTQKASEGGCNPHVPSIRRIRAFGERKGGSIAYE